MIEGNKPADPSEFDMLNSLEGEIISARAILFAIVDLMGLPLTDFNRRARSIGERATLAEDMLGRAEDAVQPLHQLYFSRKASADA